MSSPLRWFGKLTFLDGSDVECIGARNSGWALDGLLNAASDWCGCDPDEIEVSDRTLRFGGEIVGYFAIRPYSDALPDLPSLLPAAARVALCSSYVTDDVRFVLTDKATAYLAQCGLGSEAA